MASVLSPHRRRARPEDPVAPGTDRRAALGAIAAVAGLTLVAAALRVPTLDAASLWFDEAVTLSLLRMDLGAMLAQIPLSESTPPLYYLTAWVWSRVLGGSEVMVRALSAAAGIATVPVLYAAAARLAGRRAGLIAAALVAVSPLLVWHSQDARAYALFALLSALSLLALARALDDPRPRRLAAWGVAAALALATHYFAAFLIAGEAAWLLARHGRHRPVLAAIAVPALAGAALVPVALTQRAHGGASWLAERVLGERLEDLGLHLLAGYGAAPGPLASYEAGSPPGLTIAAGTLVAGALALTAFVAARAPRRRDGEGRRARGPSERRGLLLAATLALACLGLPLLLALVGFDYVFTRNLLPAWLTLCLLLATGLGARRAGLLGAVLAVALCGVLAAVTIAASASPRFGPDNWLSLARGLGGPEAERVVMAPASIAMPLALERPGLATLPAAGAQVEEIVVLRRGGAERRSPEGYFRLVERRVLGNSFTLFRFRSRIGVVRVTPSGLLGTDPLRRRRTAVLLAPAVAGLGRARAAPPKLSFCAPPPGDRRSRIAIRTSCAQAYPRGPAGLGSPGDVARPSAPRARGRSGAPGGRDR